VAIATPWPFGGGWPPSLAMGVAGPPPFSPIPFSALWVKVISVAVESYKSNKVWFTAGVKKSRSKDDKVCFTNMTKGL
jgi:hypothetical protein